MTKPKSKPKAATRSASRKTSKSAHGRAFIFKDDNAARHQARPHYCDASSARRRNDCSPHDRHGLAAAFGARLSCWSRSQKARSQSCFRTDRQRPGLSHQGRKGFVRRQSREAGGVMRCWRNVAMVVPRPKLPLRTRSRICAVSISTDFGRDGRAYSRDLARSSASTFVVRNHCLSHPGRPLR